MYSNFLSCLWIHDVDNFWLQYGTEWDIVSEVVVVYDIFFAAQVNQFCHFYFFLIIKT